MPSSGLCVSMSERTHVTHPPLETPKPPSPIFPLSWLTLSPDGLSCEGWVWRVCVKALFDFSSGCCLGAGGVT